MAKQGRKPTSKVAAKTTRSRTTRSTTRPARGSAAVRLTDEHVRQRAYEIYMARNGGPGDALADWTQAERELRGELRR